MASLLTTEQLLEDRALTPLLEATETGFAADLLARVQRVCRGGKEVSLLVAGMGVQVLLLPFGGGGDAKGEAWRAVLLLVAHRYPKVRKATADALYVHLLTYGEEALPPLPDDGATYLDADGNEAGAAAADPAAALEALNGLLLETPWLDNADAHAKPARAAMLATLGLRPPQRGGGAGGAREAAGAGGGDVRESGGRGGAEFGRSGARRCYSKSGDLLHSLASLEVTEPRTHKYHEIGLVGAESSPRTRRCACKAARGGGGDGGRRRWIRDGGREAEGRGAAAQRD